MLAIYWRQY